jgi:hypothetical protein
MDEERVIAAFEQATLASCWTDYLCMEARQDGSIKFTMKGREVLAMAGELDSFNVVWPDGYDPDNDEAGECPWPISIDGNEVVACEDGIYLGKKLVPKDDGATTTFGPKENEEARKWVLENYGDAAARAFKETLRKDPGFNETSPHRGHELDQS